MSKFGTLVEVGRTFGVRDGMLRLAYELQRGSGFMSRRLRSAQGWDAWRLERIAPGTTAADVLRSRREGSPAFFFNDIGRLAPGLCDLTAGDEQKRILSQAEQILAGRFPYFGRLSFECGFPPAWFRNPETGQEVSPHRSWTTMRFASPEYGDLKFILEPSRFLFIYPLARAYALSGDDRFAQAFWQIFDDWAAHNPPMDGPMWICGQESSLRILAWSFALRAFIHSAATTPERCAALLSAVASHAWRTEQTIGYARSQRSNHLVTEAAGLWTAGALYPELSRACRWRDLGTRLLQEAVIDQFTPEGLYLQHSFNYQRMALHLLLWTLQLAKLHHAEIPAQVSARTSAGLDFLSGVIDPVSGYAPNYGANDGTLALPLDGCDFRDFRPLLQLGAAVLDHPAPFSSGLWNEPALWICGHVPHESGGRRPSLPAGTGFHRLGNDDSWALVHASRYRRRPFHADQLSVDLWHKGLNLAQDAGTYLYNGESPWDNGLSRSVVHNTLTVDGRDQMRRAGRFLWVDWAQAWGNSTPTRFDGEHDGYHNLGLKHHRSIECLAGAGWIFIDDLLGAGLHEARLHWLVAQLPFELTANSPFQLHFGTAGMCFRWSIFSSRSGSGTIITGGKPASEPAGVDTTLFGWHSPTYGELSPAISLQYRVHGQVPLRIVTVILIQPDVEVALESETVTVRRRNEPLYQIGIVSNGENASTPLFK